MKTPIRRAMLVRNFASFILGSLFLSAIGMEVSHAQESSPLFLYVPEADLSDRQMRQFDNYRGDPTVSQIKIIMIDTTSPPTEGPVRVDLFEDKGIQFQSIRVTKRTAGSYSLFGTSSGEDGEVTLVIDGTDVVGTIRKGTQLYSVLPLGDGFQALILRDQEAFPPDEPPGFQEEMEKQMRDKGNTRDDADR